MKLCKLNNRNSSQTGILDLQFIQCSHTCIFVIHLFKQGGAKVSVQFYSGEYTKYRVYSYIIIYPLLYCFLYKQL